MSCLVVSKCFDVTVSRPNMGSGYIKIFYKAPPQVLAMTSSGIQRRFGRCTEAQVKVLHSYLN